MIRSFTVCALLAVVGLRSTSYAFVPQTHSFAAARPKSLILHVATVPPVDALEEVDALMEKARALEVEAIMYEEEAKMLDEEARELEEQIIETKAGEEAKTEEDIEKAAKVIMEKEAAEVKDALKEAQKKTKSSKEMSMNAAPVQEETKEAAVPTVEEEGEIVAMEKIMDKLIAEKEAEPDIEAVAEEKQEQQVTSQQQDVKEPVKSMSLGEIIMMNNAAQTKEDTNEVIPVVEDKEETEDSIEVIMVNNAAPTKEDTNEVIPVVEEKEDAQASIAMEEETEKAPPMVKEEADPVQVTSEQQQYPVQTLGLKDRWSRMIAQMQENIKEIIPPVAEKTEEGSMDGKEYNTPTPDGLQKDTPKSIPLNNAVPVEEKPTVAPVVEEKENTQASIAMEEETEEAPPEAPPAVEEEEEEAAQVTSKQQQYPMQTMSLKDRLTQMNTPMQENIKEVIPPVVDKKEDVGIEEFMAKGETEATAVFSGLQKDTPKSIPPPKGINKMQKAEPYTSSASFEEGAAVEEVAAVVQEEPAQQITSQQQQQQQQDVTKPAKSMSLREIMMKNNIWRN